ncbi:coronin-1A-like isoform X2 [Mizuhopecten yessoensis]|uniref:coronin-1A-like isoform X2 n=1 Tax=Mizuhopecten yessoensis TaxID=6573 RepID=UPI000B45D2A0|nr:coronin-1A-like isoform X2 [Mizuhopecten yessoensis]
MAFMRKSKFRHVFGKAMKRDQCYDCIRTTKQTWDRPFAAANPKFLAVITESGGGGAFLVLPLSKVGRVERDVPQVTGHQSAVLDIAWCPHNDNLIASASDDCSVMIWNIPDRGLTTNMETPVVDLRLHQRRVGLVIWHPVAANVLLSAGSDNKIYIWNAGLGEAFLEIDVPDLIFSASFNFNGSKVVTTCKDKTMRIIDCRTGVVISENKPHESSKPAQAVYLKDGRIFTTGFSRMSERQYAVWDEKLKNLSMEEIDNNNGVLFPQYDSDLNIMFLAAKGDSIIRYYEITNESPFAHFLTLYQSKESQRGFAYQNKRGLDMKACEITKMYKIHNSGLCEVIPFTVPRKSELFQDDLFPDTAKDQAALTAEEWFEGKDAAPIMMSLKDKFLALEGTTQSAAKPIRKANVLDNINSTTPQKAPPMKTAEQSAPKPAPAPARAPSPVPAPAPTPAPAPAPVAAPPAKVAAAPPPKQETKPPAVSDNAVPGASLPADNSKLLGLVTALQEKVEAQDGLIGELQKRVAALEAAAESKEEDN